MRVFCFPYAGGSASIYRGWQAAMPEGVEICPVHLPGRVPRFDETPFTNLNDLVNAIADGLIHAMDRPFILFGHSMGAMIAFELTRTLRERGARLPDHLIVSGRRAPRRVPHHEPLVLMSDDEFLSAIRSLNGGSSASNNANALQNDQVLEAMLPTLRADMTVVQTHRYAILPPLECPITALAGTDDPAATVDDLRRWRGHTTGPFRLHTFNGGHFFIDSHKPDVLSAVARITIRHLPPAPMTNRALQA